MTFLHVSGLNAYLCFQEGWENQLTITWINFYKWCGILMWNMSMFVSTLEGEAQAWYKSLPDASIDGWDSFQEKFINRWENKRDIFLFCTFFSIIKKHESETIFQFNARFSNFYNQITYRVRSNEDVALIFYLEAFDGIFGVFLRNEDPQILEEAQVAAIKLERNHLAACELPRIYVSDQPVQKGDSSILDDPEPIATPIESQVEFHEDEGEDVITLECSWFPLKGKRRSRPQNISRGPEI
jgi:hypothetical protein